MYPEPLFWWVDLYAIFLGIGIVACLLVFRFYLTDKILTPKLFNFFLIISISSIMLGFVFASLFQSFFNFLENGQFDLFSGGITFYGGLFGGILCYFLNLFIFGRFLFHENEHFKNLGAIINVAPCCITIAHAFGRLGCLCAGCCHGYITEGFGLRMWVAELQGYYNCVPVQLYESIFLFILFGVLTFLYFKKIHIEMETYCIGYGIWRFVIEFFRNDDRGNFFIKFLTPSQGFAILFILSGIAIIVYKIVKKQHKKANINA